MADDDNNNTDNGPDMSKDIDKSTKDETAEDESAEDEPAEIEDAEDDMDNEPDSSFYCDKCTNA